jgi:hypothetical protein
METWTYDPETNLWDSVVTTLRPAYRGVNYGLAYDSKNGIVLLVGGNIKWGGAAVSEMIIYHPLSKTWEKVAPPAVNGYTPRGYALTTAYDSRHNVFMITAGPWTGAHEAVWAYRYKNSSVKAELLKGATSILTISSSPNPFTPSSTVTITIPSRSEIELSVHTIDGKMVKRITNGTYNAGQYKFTWHTNNREGKLSAAGIYLYKIRADRTVKYFRTVFTR